MKRRGRPRHPDILTVREWEVLDLLREDLSNEAIADRLGISAETVKSHVSSILLKLGAETRREAAAWRPETTRHIPLLAPLGALRRVHFGSLTPLVGGGVVVVAAAAVGALLWGVLATGGPSNSAGSDRWSYIESTTGAPSVMLFDVSKHEARRLDVSDDVRGARWVKPGESFVAHGTAVDDYPIFGLTGSKVLTMSLQGDLTKEVVPAPDGAALLVGRTDNQYVVANFPNGNGATLATGATDLAFSPDGRQVAWAGLGNLDKDGNVHPGRTIYVSLKNVITGFAGAGIAITSQFDSDGVLDLAPEPWSPDSKLLLVEQWPACATGATCQRPPTYEVYGTAFTDQLAWKEADEELLSAQWAGPENLFVVFRPGIGSDPAFPNAGALLVDFLGNKSVLPPPLADADVLSFSPDGNHVVARVGQGVAWEQRCGLLDVRTGREIAGFDATPGDENHGFCSYANWTHDGSMVIVSQGGGN